MSERFEDVWVRRIAAGVAAEPIRAAIASPGVLDRAHVLKREGRSGVWRLTLAGRDVVLKAQVDRGGPARVWGLLDAIRGASGRTRLDRHWRGAERLLAAGIPTAAPLALLRARLGGQAATLLVTDAVDGDDLLNALPAADRAHQTALAQAAGALVARLWMTGILNRDHKPSNLLVACRPADATSAHSPTHPTLPPPPNPALPRLVMIDVVGLARCEVDRIDGAPVRMLASLVIEPLGCGVLPRRSVLRAALRGFLQESWDNDRHARARGDLSSMNAEWERQSARALWEMVSERVRAHGDPTPRVSPLRTWRRSPTPKP